MSEEIAVNFKRNVTGNLKGKALVRKRAQNYSRRQSEKFSQGNTKTSRGLYLMLGESYNVTLGKCLRSRSVWSKARLTATTSILGATLTFCFRL